MHADGIHCAIFLPGFPPINEMVAGRCAMNSLGTGGFRMAALRVLAAIGLVLASGTVSVVRAQAGRIYWTDSNNGGNATAKVHRVDFDGTHSQPLVLPASLNPRYLALDPEGGKMYWTDIGVINRANLDGTGQLTLINAGRCPMGIALDVRAAKVYWTDCVEGRIMRANLIDGSAVEEVIGGLGELRGLALDLVHGKMYWTNPGAHMIQRSNLDGTDKQDLVAGQFPQGIVLNVEGGTMYWPDMGDIHRANLDGTSD